MSNLLKIVAVIILAFIAVTVVTTMVQAIWKLVFPLLIIGTVGYIVYRVVTPKSIGGRRGGILP